MEIKKTTIAASPFQAQQGRRNPDGGGGGVKKGSLG